MSKKNSTWAQETRISHAGRKPDENFGLVNPPVYHASTVTFPTVQAMHEASAKPFEGVYYGRYGTPTTFAFEEAVAELEGADKCIATSSGLGAIVGGILPFVESGDHVLMVDSAYAPTRKFCDGFLKKFGVTTSYYDPMIGAGIADDIRDNTKVVFTESPGSLTFEVQDIDAIADAAHKAGAVVVMDNTWSAGLFYPPFEHGVDVSVQAATKYIAGHSDVMLGTISVQNALFEKVKSTVVGLGYAAAPDDCYLGHRGIRTLASRLRQHEETGLKLAAFLQGRPEVDRVLHPALPECPGHDLWQRDFTGACGLFSIVLKEHHGHEAMARMLDHMELYAMGYSWGGYESLIMPSNPATIRTATTWDGPGSLLRIHAGLEDADDLIADLAAGLDRLSE